MEIYSKGTMMLFMVLFQRNGFQVQPNQTPVALADDDNGWFLEPEDGWDAN